MAGKPPLIYWNAATLSCIAAVRELQREGAPVFFTIDAGPQVKAVCLPEAEQRVATALRGLPGVLDIIVTGLGPGVQSL
jgi:diphosphomevalonate decarboxylase